MSKKVLYLGGGKWCWTESCSKHAQIIGMVSQYKSAVREHNAMKIVKSMQELLSTVEGTHTLRYLQTQSFTENLGRKPNIGLDLDGTTGDFTFGLREWQGRKLNIPREEWLSKLPEPDEYSMWLGDNAWYTDRDHFMREFQAAEKDGLYKTLPVFQKASPVLNDLKNYGFNIKVITARNELYNTDTAAWIKANKIPAMRQILNYGIEKEKASNIDVYLEDAPVVIERLINSHKKVVVMDQLYNEKIPEDASLRRARGWETNIVESIFGLLDSRKETEPK